ncbi:hypothetical protein [Chloroflexus sp.]|uniref:hypothetical protein n=1 Tax=Chloroflexus sp. TaxID=1904827 RepID=UPI0026107D3A|nr:hypothetical protein [uncultured Chloroflexus sp.]
MPAPAHLNCPRCGQALTPEDTYLRCVTHGLFFRYGPRLLVAAPTAEDHSAHLMPWQTLTEEAPELLILPATTAAATAK